MQHWNHPETTRFSLNGTGVIGAIFCDQGCSNARVAVQRSFKPTSMSCDQRPIEYRSCTPLQTASLRQTLYILRLFCVVALYSLRSLTFSQLERAIGSRKLLLSFRILISFRSLNEAEKSAPRLHRKAVQRLKTAASSSTWDRVHDVDR